jgi:hypothetical protein
MVDAKPATKGEIPFDHQKNLQFSFDHLKN